MLEDQRNVWTIFFCQWCLDGPRTPRVRQSLLFRIAVLPLTKSLIQLFIESSSMKISDVRVHWKIGAMKWRHARFHGHSNLTQDSWLVNDLICQSKLFLYLLLNDEALWELRHFWVSIKLTAKHDFYEIHTIISWEDSSIIDVHCHHEQIFENIIYFMGAYHLAVHILPKFMLEKSKKV